MSERGEVFILRDRGVHDGLCKCGAHGARVYVEHNDNTLGHQCDACWDASLNGLDQARRDATEMRARGVSERMVQRVMCARVERGEYPRRTREY